MLQGPSLDAFGQVHPFRLDPFSLKNFHGRRFDGSSRTMPDFFSFALFISSLPDRQKEASALLALNYLAFPPLCKGQTPASRSIRFGPEGKENGRGVR